MEHEIVELLVKNLDKEIEEMELANKGLLELEPITDALEFGISKMLFDVVPDTIACLQILLNKINTLKYLTNTFHCLIKDRIESSPLNKNKA